MTPMVKMDRRSSAPPENMLTMPKMVSALSRKKLGDALRVDARHGDVRADAIDDQTADQEQQALAYVAETRRVAEY